MLKRNAQEICNCSSCKVDETKNHSKNATLEIKHSVDSPEALELFPEEKKPSHVKRGRPRIKEKPPKSLKNVIEECEKIDFNEKDFDRLVAMLDTKNPVECTQALVGLSKLFLREEGKPIF